MPKKRFIKILILPIAIVVYMIGLVAISYGKPKQQKNLNPQTNKQPTQKTNPEIEIGIITPEKEQTITAH